MIDMPKNKGFTLIELTGVMVVISLILLFTLPQIIQNMKDAKTREYNRFVEDLKMATETYVESNRDNYPQLNITGGSVTLTITDLINAGLVKKDIINPSSNQAVTDEDSIIVTKQDDGTLKYEFIDSTLPPGND